MASSVLKSVEISCKNAVRKLRRKRMNNTLTPGEAGTNNAMLRTESYPESSNSSIPTDVFPDFAVSLEEANARIKMFQQYVREHMVEGEDYGVIPGSTKPTLFKPGAEKLNAIFGYAPRVEISNRVEDWDKGFVSYEVKVSLINKRTGQIEAEGLGSCNSRERRYARQDAAGIANTVLKMAKKRAVVDATLSATRASGLFTQDLEDLDQFNGGDRHAAPAVERAPVRQPAPDNNREAARQSTPPEVRQEAPAPSYDTSGGTAGNVLTDAQHRAILAIANRVFGRPATAEDFAQLADKPLEDLTKGEASSLIDKLRYRLAETQAGGQSNGQPQRSFQRSDDNGRSANRPQR